MKRIFILLAVMLMTVGLFAEEAVLIDFTRLAADIIPSTRLAPGQDEQMTQNRATIMDFGAVSGGSFTDNQRELMRTSLAIRNWSVRLNSSARTPQREVLSYVEEADSKQFGTVLGVRVNFPTEPWNSHAFVRPPFEIPAFEPLAQIDDQGNITQTSTGVSGFSRFEGPVDDVQGRPPYAYGVVKNVGVIRSVAVNVYGLNFPHSLSAILIDNEGNERIVFMGFLDFDGWGELLWNNPAYIEHVRNRELRLIPLYPTATPFVKFGGFLISRDGDRPGGDFITYFRDVKIIYDKAVLDTDRDIDDEGLWNIIRTRETSRQNWEMSRFGQMQILRYLEQEKQATETTFTPSPRIDQ